MIYRGEDGEGQSRVEIKIRMMMMIMMMKGNVTAIVKIMAKVLRPGKGDAYVW